MIKIFVIAECSIGSRCLDQCLCLLLWCDTSSAPVAQHRIHRVTRSHHGRPDPLQAGEIGQRVADLRCHRVIVPWGNRRDCVGRNGRQIT